jgi:hypothetical protein
MRDGSLTLCASESARGARARQDTGVQKLILVQALKRFKERLPPATTKPLTGVMGHGSLVAPGLPSTLVLSGIQVSGEPSTIGLPIAPKDPSYGEALPASEPMPCCFLPGVPLLADSGIAPRRLAVAGEAGHIRCHGPAVESEGCLSQRAGARRWTASGTSEDQGRRASDAKLASSKTHPQQE